MSPPYFFTAALTERCLFPLFLLLSLYLFLSSPSCFLNLHLSPNLLTLSSSASYSILLPERDKTGNAHSNNIPHPLFCFLFDCDSASNHAIYTLRCTIKGIDNPFMQQPDVPGMLTIARSLPLPLWPRLLRTCRTRRCLHPIQPLHLLRNPLSQP